MLVGEVAESGEWGTVFRWMGRHFEGVIGNHAPMGL